MAIDLSQFKEELDTKLFSTASSDEADFYNGTGPDTYLSRIENRVNFNNKLLNYAYRNTFSPTDDLSAFLQLKRDHAVTSTVVIDDENPSPADSNIANPALQPDTGDKYNNVSPELTNALAESVTEIAKQQFIQYFQDIYMGATASDMQYRLGAVIATKVNWSKAAADSEKEAGVLANYDEYGRIDTTSNLRARIKIPGYGQRELTYSQDGKTIKGTTRLLEPLYEHYVNFLFPPYIPTGTSTNGQSLESYIASTNFSRTWIEDSSYEAGGYWQYNDTLPETTFDLATLMCSREKPTYRKPAFKAVNDNIMFLQWVFERVSGVVSTYLTEWDLSIYFQEGLFTQNGGVKPSVPNLTYRIFEDNPMGYDDQRAYGFGLVNAALSKTPINGIVPNEQDWNPATYPMSCYWTKYDSHNRGDGLDIFYDTALAGFNEEKYKSISFKDKIKWYDDIGAAYCGWYNWNSLIMANALYVNDEDGLSSIDTIHMTESINDYKFKTVNDVQGEIQDIIDQLYEDDETLGFGSDIWAEESVGTWQSRPNCKIKKYYKRNTQNGTAEFLYTIVIDPEDGSLGRFDEDGNSISPTGDDMSAGKSNTAGSNAASFRQGSLKKSTDDDSESDIKIMGVKIPGSRLLKKFLNRKKKAKQAMAAGMAAANGYSTSASASKGPNASNFTGDESDGNTALNGLNDSAAGGAAGLTYSALDTNAPENGQYARHSGIPQWNPALYGGPHGKHFNPRTIQGYFESNNVFNKVVPRINTSYDISKLDIKNAFKGNESWYSYSGSSSKETFPEVNISRSPSRALQLLYNGSFDYTMQSVSVWAKRGKYFKFTTSNYKNALGKELPLRYGQCLEWDGSHRYGSVVYYDPSSIEYQTTTSRVGWKSFHSELTYAERFWGSFWDYGNYGSEKYVRYFKKRTAKFFNVGIYDLYKESSVGFIYGTYHIWDIVKVKRPLIHSKPQQFWEINKVNIHSYQISRYWHPSYDRWFWWRRAFSMTTRIKAESRSTYRLTMPGAIDSVKSTWVPATEERSGYYQRHFVTKPEKDFMEKICGIDGKPEEWKRVYFFQSTTRQDRFDNGPELITRLPVKISSYGFVYWTRVTRWEWDWWHWHKRRVWEQAVGKCNFIEVDADLKSAKKDGQNNVFGACNKSSDVWDNLDVNKADIMYDIPTENYRKAWDNDSWSSRFQVNALTDPWSYMQSFLGFDLNTEESGIHGWGYTTSLPGIKPDIVDINYVEDAADYLSLSKHQKNVESSIRICDIDIPLYSMTDETYITSGTNDGVGYTTSSLRRKYKKEYVDKALADTIKKLWTTSTFYKFSTASTISKGPYPELDDVDAIFPILVGNDAPFRVLARSALYQKGFLSYARELFIDNISFADVKKVIEDSVEKDILSRSVPALGGKDIDSIYYHYWIEKAYELFSDESKKPELIIAFDNCIACLQAYLDKVESQIGRSYLNWTCQEYVDAYNYASWLQKAFLENIQPVQEYMYAYLNVLYEYRKFFINKRFNKVDGSLWAERALESCLPVMTEKIDNWEEPNEGGETSIEDGQHKYKVSMYEVQNTNYQKIAAGIDEAKVLDRDRTTTLYIKVDYVSDEEVQVYLNKFKEGKITSEDQNLIYIPKVNKYAKLPFDDTYILTSKEYYKNLANIKYNLKASDDNKKAVEDIDTCIMSIIWTDKYGTAATGNTKKAGLKHNFPYVWREPGDEVKYPNIRFGIANGIDFSKLQNLQSIKDITEENPIDVFCTVKDTSDYWKISIPQGSQPKTAGYKTNLKIVSYREVQNNNSIQTKTVAIAGQFAYSLWPITEEQANVVPEIGAGISNIQNKVKNSVTGIGIV